MKTISEATKDMIKGRLHILKGMLQFEEFDNKDTSQAARLTYAIRELEGIINHIDCLVKIKGETGDDI